MHYLDREPGELERGEGRCAPSTSLQSLTNIQGGEHLLALKVGEFTPAAPSCTGTHPSCRCTASGGDHLLDPNMCGHSFREHVIALGRLEIGVAEQVRRDADLLGGAVDQLGDGAIPEKMGPNVPAEGVAGAFFDLVPYRRAVHRPTGPTEPKVTLDADLPLSRSN